MNSDKKYAYAIGTGIALFSIHNKWLADTTAINGDAVLFLPAFGSVIWILATLFFLRDNYKMNWGDKKVWIPLLIIVGAIGLSGITADTIGGKFAPLLMGSMLFSLYLVSRKLGKDIFTPLAIGAAIASAGVIISGFIWVGKVTGGLVFERNYDIAIGYIILGAVLYRGRFSSILRSIGMVAVFLTGAPEGLFAAAVIGLVVLWRKDWGSKLVFVLAPVIIIASLWFGQGWCQSLYGYTYRIADAAPSDVAEVLSGPVSSPVIPDFAGDSAIGFRLKVIDAAKDKFQPLGEGYNLTAFRTSTVHNVPLIIVQQLGIPGILAAIAWLWVCVYGLIKTKWKYAWIVLLTLSFFDHFVWTQMAPMMWCVIGVSATSLIETDLVFKNAS
jgi:hypothetical protein